MRNGAIESAVLWVLVILVMLGLVLVGYQEGKSSMRSEAKKAGSGEFYLDTNDVRQWRWK